MGCLADQRHEQFAQLLASGMGQREAYNVLYPKATGASASTLANRLKKRPEIHRRVKEIQDQTAGQVVMSLQEKREYLANVVRDKTEKFDPGQKIKAIQVDTELAGHAPAKELDVNVCSDVGSGLMDETFMARLAAAFQMRTMAPRPPNPAEKNGDPP